MAVSGGGGGPVQPSRCGLVAASGPALGVGPRCTANGLQQSVPGHKTGLLFHSDRGSQYASDEFRQVLERFGIQPSMSRKGDCWDNACSETLFASLKVERLHGRKFATLRQAKDETLDWLHCYNQRRLHSTLNYVSQMQFEKDWQQAAVTTC